MTVSAHGGTGERERPRWLLAFFETEMQARRAVQAAQLSGVDPRLMRMGKSLDTLSSVQTVMQQASEASLADTKEPRTRESSGRGLGRLAGWFRAGARRKRPQEPHSGSAGTIVAVPDSKAARRVLLRASAIRIDVLGAGGYPIATLASDDPSSGGVPRVLGPSEPNEPEPD